MFEVNRMGKIQLTREAGNPFFLLGTAWQYEITRSDYICSCSHLLATMNWGIYIQSHTFKLSDYMENTPGLHLYIFENNIKDDRENASSCNIFLRPGMVKINLTRPVNLKHNLFFLWPNRR